MSLAQSFEKKRVVIPRWRSLSTTPSVETIPTANFTDLQPVTVDQFRDFIKIWRASGKPEDIVDILDAGIATGQRKIVVEAATLILRNSDEYARTIVNRANSIFYGKPSVVLSVPRNTDVAGDSIQKISRLKKVLSESPRNSLAHVEIARLYTRLGQVEKANRHLRAALQINGNDRFTLRALTRFLTLVHEPGEALRLLRAAPATRSDPWLQSAELAAGMLVGSGLRRFAANGRLIEGRKSIPIEFSELATGWATQLEISGASRKKVFATLLPSLAQPTENALAQGVWLTDHLGEDFSTRFSAVSIPIDAHEARALALTEQEEFNDACREAELWVVDQPFQLRSFIFLCHLRFAHLGDFEGAITAATEGLIIHGDDWSLLNYATISYAAAGNTEKANSFLKRFSKVANSDRKNAFFRAAEGMVLFSAGKYFEAADKYVETLRMCSRRSLLSLIPSVVMFFVDNLSRHSLLTRDEYKLMTETIAHQISKLPKQEARDAQRAFSSLKARWQLGLQSQVIQDPNGPGVEKLLMASRELEPTN